MTQPTTRPAAKEAGPELLVLARMEEFTGWLLDRTAKWPKSARFTLTQRIENAALDIVEDLVAARYQTRGRRQRLEAVNLRLERMRHLFRLAKGPKQAEEAQASTTRVIRGGSWNNTVGNARAANRNRNTPENRNTNIGFRPASP